MSHEAKFKQGDLIVNEYGETGVVRVAEPDGSGRVIVNRAENPDSEKAWVSVYQGFWTKVRQYPERWLVVGLSGGGVVFSIPHRSLEAALRTARRQADKGYLSVDILHIQKDGTTEWVDIEEDD